MAVPRGAEKLPAALLLAGCLLFSGCAGPGGFFADDKPAFRDPALMVDAARQSVVAGQTTKADVLAALGPSTAIRFDSGYEVWVYRAAAIRGLSREELVILFDPAGVVQKSRVRPPYKLP
ncbi:MAG: hypothetical protein EOO28_14830 [Comamonadaceae bacterium]|nr:MAG: hypothetical protein EOO28_14830 [Comamonadaceae bacterium]